MRKSHGLSQNNNRRDDTPRIKTELMDEFAEDFRSFNIDKVLDGLGKLYPESEAYLVGGILRDKMIGRESKDFDFVVRNVPATDLGKFLEGEGKVNLVGKNFSVFKFLPADSMLKIPIDFALPRTEISTDMGYRDVKVNSDPQMPIEDDLSRRDFTINAMALDCQSGELIDKFGGRADIKDKLIRAVGDPKTRFIEDLTRILRGVRQASQLGFVIEGHTWEAIQKFGPKILSAKKDGEQYVPWETISDEFILAMRANPARALELFSESGMMKEIIPEIETLKNVPQPEEFHQEGDVFDHTLLALRGLKPGVSDELILATMLHDISKPETLETPEKDGVDRVRTTEHETKGAELAETICARLRIPKHRTERVTWLVKNHMLFAFGKVEEMRPGTLRKYFIDDPKLGDDLLELYRVDVLASKSPQQEQNLEEYAQVKDYVLEARAAMAEADLKPKHYTHLISGEDVMKTFDLKEGKEVGRLLERAKDFIVGFIADHKKEPTKKEIIDHLKDK